MHIWRHLWLERYTTLKSRNAEQVNNIPTLLCSVAFQPEMAPNVHLVYIILFSEPGILNNQYLASQAPPLSTALKGVRQNDQINFISRPKLSLVIVGLKISIIQSFFWKPDRKQDE